MLGQLLFAIACVGMIFAAIDSNPYWLIPTVVAVSMLVVTSKFGNQQLLATVAGLLIVGAWPMFFAIVVGMLLCFALWGNKGFNVLRGQITHSVAYYKHLQEPFLMGHRSSVRLWLQQLIAVMRLATRSPVQALVHVVRLNFWPHRFVVLFTGFPIAIAAIYLMPFPDESRSVLAALLISAFVAAIATAQRSLSFLGEWHRYLEHTVVVQSALIALLLANSHPIIIAFFVLYGLFFYINSIQMFSQQYRAHAQDAESLSNLLGSIDEESSKVFVLGALFWPVLYATRHLKLHCYNANIDLSRFRGNSFQDLFGNFPNPGRSFKDLAPLYGIDFVVGRSDDFDFYGRVVDDGKFEGLTLKNRQGTFLLYSVDDRLPRAGMLPVVS